MIIKQCTKLLPYDTSLYTVYAVYDGNSEGIGGGINSPAEYKAVKDIISKEIYDSYVVNCCIDDRRLPQFWTPYSPDQEELEPVKSITEDDVFKIEVVSPNVLHRKRQFNE